MGRRALDAFELRPDGSWICIRRVAVPIRQSAAVVDVEVGRSFVPGTAFAGYDDFTARLGRRRCAARRAARIRLLSHACRLLIGINDIFGALHKLRRDRIRGGATMRALHHLVAVAALLLFAASVKIVVPVTPAEAAHAATLNVMQMQANDARILPVQPLHDMTFALE
jgi:hypothetical protein